MLLILSLSISLAAIFLFFLYRWPWALIALAILVPFNFFYFVDKSFLPSITIASGVQIQFEDLIVLSTFLMGVAYFIARKKVPLFLLESLIMLAIVIISSSWGITQGYINPKIAVGGFRQLFGWLFYIGLSGILIAVRDWRQLLRIVTTLVILSVIIQFFEFIFQNRMALPTSTGGFYSSTVYLPIGNMLVPYIWNRIPGLLFLVYFICVGRWFVMGPKKYLLFSLIFFVFVIITLVRAWVLYVIFGTAVLIITKYIATPKYGKLFVLSIFFLFSIALLISVGFGLLTLNSDFSFSSPTLNRFVSLSNYRSDSSYLIRTYTNEVFYDAFMKGAFWGHGLGYIRELEIMFGIWSTDVGIIASMSEFGLLVVIPVFLLFAKAYRLIFLILRKGSYHEVAYAYGLIGFFSMSLLATLLTQNYLFTSPWSISFFIGLVILEIQVRMLPRSPLKIANNITITGRYNKPH